MKEENIPVEKQIQCQELKLEELNKLKPKFHLEAMKHLKSLNIFSGDALAPVHLAIHRLVGSLLYAMLLLLIRMMMMTMTTTIILAVVAMKMMIRMTMMMIRMTIYMMNKMTMMIRMKMMMIRMITFIMMIDNIHIIIGPLKEQRSSCLNFIILSTLSYIYDTSTKILASPLHVLKKT